jgi:hypothetical protein
MMMSSVGGASPTPSNVPKLPVVAGPTSASGVGAVSTPPTEDNLSSTSTLVPNPPDQFVPSTKAPNTEARSGALRMGDEGDGGGAGFLGPAIPLAGAGLVGGVGYGLYDAFGKRAPNTPEYKQVTLPDGNLLRYEPVQGKPHLAQRAEIIDPKTGKVSGTIEYKYGLTGGRTAIYMDEAGLPYRTVKEGRFLGVGPRTMIVSEREAGARQYMKFQGTGQGPNASYSPVEVKQEEWLGEGKIGRSHQKINPKNGEVRDLAQRKSWWNVKQWFAGKKIEAVDESNLLVRNSVENLKKEGRLISADIAHDATTFVKTKGFHWGGFAGTVGKFTAGAAAVGLGLGLAGTFLFRGRGGGGAPPPSMEAAGLPEGPPPGLSAGPNAMAALPPAGAGTPVDMRNPNAIIAPAGGQA